MESKAIKKRNIDESSSLPKLDRKIVERNRRIQLKGLCSHLASLIPPPHHHFNSKEMLSQHDQLDLAASYIKQLSERIEKLKKIKEQAILMRSTGNNSAKDRKVIGLREPLVELRDLGSCIEVVLISGLKKNFMFSQVISVLGEEGAEVVSASVSTVGDNVFHTIHAQVRIARVGVETTRICQRLQELAY